MAITFKQFIELVERYYEPHEKLPSGKTPYEKAGASFDRQEKAYYSKPPEKRTLKHAKRMAQQITNVNRHVRFGADHKDFKDYKEDGLEVKKGKYTSGMTVNHPESGLKYNVAHTGHHDEKGRPIHDVSFSHKGRYVPHHNDKTTTPEQKKEIARKAAHIWHNSVAPRIPTGMRLRNTPVSNDTYDSKTNTIKTKNTRAKIYQRHGFSPMDDRGDQHAEVTRPPSSKRAAKGAKRLKSIDAPTNRSSHNDEWDD